ncbi:MAG: hypothetical protein HW386_2321 [Gammaproteobacteria bacterium]|nr:hypothetical protein [Gammaproteobacteria bacterium]
MRIIGVPADLYYRERISKERSRPVAEKMFDTMLASLTKPITPEEARPKIRSTGTENLKFTADTIGAAIEDCHQMFLANQWSDGLPFIPPTPERVKWMLSGTNRAPGEELGPISPRNGMATIEKIAINAVMAGASPEYLPVIIAAVEGLADPDFDELHFATSTGSFNLVIAVSGPMADEIGMNSGLGLLSYGNRANSSIGRAVRLAMINFGHTWPAQNDMALVGRPGAHAFLTFAENQAQSPWPSYHEAQGFRPDDNTVTLTVTGGYSTGNTGANIYGGGAVALVPPESILKSIASDITNVRGGVAADDSTGNLLAGNEKAVRSNYRKYFIVFNPEVAQELQSRLGYTRESLQEYLFETASIPYELLSAGDIDNVKRAIDIGYIPTDRVARFRAGLQPGGTVPMLSRPGDVHIIVAGGIPGYTMMMSYFLDGIYKPVAHISKLISGAQLTKTGR